MAENNRTEKGTPHRRKQARDRGQVVRSRDLTGALTLLAATLLLAWEPQLLIGKWRALFDHLLSSGTQGEIGLGTPIITMTALAVGETLAPVLGLAFVVAIFATTAQSGFILVTEPLKPNWNRLNPVTNIQNLFSFSALSRVLRSLIPAAAILYLAVGLLERQLPHIAFASRIGSRGLLTMLGTLLFELAWKSGLVLLAWSVVDYFLQRWSFEKSIMMTKQEIKEEAKDLDGNPQTRGRFKRLRRSLFRKMLAKEVARATAIITNPTHYAVALEYRPETMAAPIVVAKGRNLIAQKIKEIARGYEIPIIENPPLAQALFKATEVGQSIPPKLYAAVAEILAFLYRAQSRMKLPQRAAAGGR